MERLNTSVSLQKRGNRVTSDSCEGDYTHHHPIHWNISSNDREKWRIGDKAKHQTSPIFVIAVVV